MAQRKPKRVRQFRGSRTHGYGRIGQHRKGGQRGGKGKTGGKKHKWTYVTAKNPTRFGKHGFNRPTPLRQDHRTINVGDLIVHLSQFTDSTSITAGQPITIDLTAHGIEKVLGAGRVTLPLKVKADLFTHRAAAKIKAAGGSIKGTIQGPTPHPAPSLTTPPKPKAKPKAKPSTTKPKAAKPKTPSRRKTKPISAKPKSPRTTAKPKTTSRKQKSTSSKSSS